MIELIKMNEGDYYNFTQSAIPEYAQDMIKAGHWSKEEAYENSQKQFYKLLTKGLETENSYLYNVVDEKIQNKVGFVWLIIVDKPVSKIGFIADIKIYDKYQGQGYGKATMRAIEERSKELGAKKMELHVFGFNKRAVSLYEKVGYDARSINMAKEL